LPSIRTDDAVNLYYEEARTGTPIVFIPEFAGDYRSWKPQMRHFSRRYCCITYGAHRSASPPNCLEAAVPGTPQRAC
jgi:pimeloyl-ACP methyl ester carboxylesterase